MPTHSIISLCNASYSMSSIVGVVIDSLSLPLSLSFSLLLLTHIIDSNCLYHSNRIRAVCNFTNLPVGVVTQFANYKEAAIRQD